MATPGNTIALKSGADSERAILAKLPETRKEVLDVAPWLAEEPDQVAVERFCRAETRARMLDAWIVATTEHKGPQAVKPWAWQEANRADRLAAELGHSLGLDPLGRARLQRETADAGRSRFDLARALMDDDDEPA
jgi:hypothetical protein